MTFHIYYLDKNNSPYQYRLLNSIFKRRRINIRGVTSLPTGANHSTAEATWSVMSTEQSKAFPECVVIPTHKHSDASAVGGVSIGTESPHRAPVSTEHSGADRGWSTAGIS